MSLIEGYAKWTIDYDPRFLSSWQGREKSKPSASTSARFSTISNRSLRMAAPPQVSSGLCCLHSLTTQACASHEGVRRTGTMPLHAPTLAGLVAVEQGEEGGEEGGGEGEQAGKE